MSVSAVQLRQIIGGVLLLIGITFTYKLMLVKSAAMSVVKNEPAKEVVFTPVAKIETESTPAKKKAIKPPTIDDGEIFPRLIAYNKVDKCGSRSLVALAKELSRRNNFTVHNGGFFHGNYISPQDVIVKEAKYLNSFDTPSFFYVHFYYVNFNKYGIPNPVYINLIRDPVDRFASLYNFQKYGDNKGIGGTATQRPEINKCVATNNFFCAAGQATSIHIAKFFCGQNTGLCDGMQETVRLAKQHIDENYVFIGLTEEFDATLQILERLLPDYFRGAPKVWADIRNETLHKTKTSKKEELTPESRILMRQRLAPDYEIYNHVKKKFNDLKKQFNIR